MTPACVWCGKPKDEHTARNRLCPVSGVTSQFYTPPLRPIDLQAKLALKAIRDARKNGNNTVTLLMCEIEALLVEAGVRL